MSDIQALTIPKWGLSMEQGTVTKWLIAEGDSFAEGDEIVEIETDKIANVVEAPFTGRLSRIVAEPGSTLPVGALIGVSAGEAAPADAIESFLNSYQADISDEPPAQNSSSSVSSAPQDVASDEQPAQPERNVDSVSTPDALHSDADDASIHATRHARLFANSVGVNLTKVTGTGRNGRVSRADVEAAILDHGGSLPATSETTRENSASAVPAPAVQSAPVLPSAGAVDISPLSNMRKTIAQRLVASKHAAPHYRVTMDCVIDDLLATRTRLNATNPDEKISINDFIIKASAMALIAEPECNVQFDGENVHYFPHADITVAVALPAGLITPKIEKADAKGLAEISREMKSLAERAKSGGLTPDEYQGGTFSISNLGMFGVSSFDAIINPPQCAILAVGAGAHKYIPGDDGPRKVTEISLCLSSDHRIIDGALAARLLSRIKQNIENPLLMLA